MNPPSSHSSRWIIDTTAATFQRDVFDRSHDLPVIVDFWAAWCAPCRMLAPVLEHLAEEHDGKFLLVKANTEEVPAAAGQFGVQGIPAVYAVCGGEIVDFFAGALPEPQIRTWLERVFAANEVFEARRLEETFPAAAEAKYRHLLAQSPNDAEAHIGLARTLLAQERCDESRAVIDELARRGFLEPEAERVKAALDLRGMEGFDVPALQAQVAAEPGNLALQLQLAEALAGTQQYEAALELCLSLVQRDRKEFREQARQIMVDIFRILPEESELTNKYRRKLAMALY